jgi:Protein kinase domain
MPDSNDTPTTAGGSPADPNATRPGATADAGPPGAVLLSQPLASGSRDRYSVTRLHATGGLGRVWLAHDPGMNREVALKELLPERSGLPAAAARFVREARITGQLEHPGIVPVYELAGDATGAPFYTMRFVRGRTFGEAIAGYHQRRASGTAGALDLRELLAAFVTLCQAVAYAHSRRVIHRDLKPANVILGDFGEVILLDWGIAKVLGEPEAADPNATRDANAGAADPGDGVSATRYGQVLGTPAYMAPEQAAGALDQIDERTDVYGLGAVLYEIATGAPPFRAETMKDLLERVRSVPPARPSTVVRDVPKPLEAVILKCLNKAPIDRYASAKELAADVQRFLADEPVSAYRDPLRVRAGRWARRNRTLVAALAVLVLVAVPALLVALVLVNGARSNERDARVIADAARAEAESNFQKAVRAAEVVSEELARGIKPIAGTQSRTVLDILARAETVYDELLAGPDPPAGVRHSKAKLLVLASDVYRGMGRVSLQRDRAERAVELCAGLPTDGPDARAFALTRGAALHRRGWAHFDTARAAEARADFRAAAEVLEAAGAASATADPEDAYALASALTLHANGLVDSGDLDGARPLYARGLQVREAVRARLPNDPNAALQVATSLERFGLLKAQTGDYNAALADQRRAVELYDAAFATDRNNQEFAVALIRGLNTCALQELASFRAAALAKVRRALDPAEAFARRDPDNDKWQREAMRANWLLGELEKRDWIRLPVEKRAEARAKQLRLLREILTLAEERYRQEPESELWLADRSNLRARVAAQLLENADAGEDPEANRAFALAAADRSIADARALLARVPDSYLYRVQLVYSLSVARNAAVAIKPDAAALVRHWKYLSENVTAQAWLYGRHPTNPEGKRELALTLAARLKPPPALSDNWLSLCADPAAVGALVELAEALPPLAAIPAPEPELRKALAAARADTADRLRRVSEKAPLSERGRKALEALAAQE